jgi:hypothetical protein
MTSAFISASTAAMTAFCASFRLPAPPWTAMETIARAQSFTLDFSSTRRACGSVGPAAAQGRHGAVQLRLQFLGLVLRRLGVVLGRGQLLVQALVAGEGLLDAGELLDRHRVGHALLLDLLQAILVGRLVRVERGHHRLDGLLDLGDQVAVVLLALDAAQRGTRHCGVLRAHRNCPPWGDAVATRQGRDVVEGGLRRGCALRAPGTRRRLPPHQPETPRREALPARRRRLAGAKS